MEGHFSRSGSALQGTLKGACDGFRVHLTVESDASPEDVAEVVRLAHASCYTEAALQSVVPVEKTASLNGRPLT